jgi:hypothetical protein
MIVNAAIRFNGKIYTGKRHAWIMNEIRKEFPDAHYPNPDDQGFVNEKGQYLRRPPALIEAIKYGQVEPGKTFQPHELFSEDIWKDS